MDRQARSALLGTKAHKAKVTGFCRHLLSAVACLLVAGCFVVGEDAEPRNNDGELCDNDGDCSSGICTSYRLCAHTSCNCPGSTCTEGGEVVDECKEGWLCSDADSIFDGAEEFFGGTPAMDQGYCHLPCDTTCPDHYYCDGTNCVPDRDWVDPEVTLSWSGAITGSTTSDQTVQLEDGKTVSVTASAASPLEIPLEPFEWKLVRGSGERVESVGDSVEFTLQDESYVRVELIVRDTEYNSVSVHVVFESCQGPGTQCGYQGSGCCNGCDRDANVCL